MLMVMISGLAWAFSPQAGRAQEAPPQEMPPAETITFDEAVRIALEQNTQLKRASNTARLQEIGVVSNWMDFFPNLNASVSGSQQYGRNFSLQEGGFTTETSEFASFGVSSNINLFNGFRDVASLDQAQLQSAASTQSLERTRQDVVFQVMESYIALVANEEQVRVLEEEVAYQQQLLERIEEFVEIGTRPTSELYQQQAATAEAELTLLQAEQTYQFSQTELIQVLHLDPFGTYVFEAPAIEGEELTPAQYDLGQLIQAAYERRADLDAEQLQVQAAQAQVRVARGGYFPRLDLSAGYGSGWSSVASPLPIEGTGTEGRFVSVEPVGGGEPVNVFVPGQSPDTYQPTFFNQLDNRRGGSISLSLSIPVFNRLTTRNSVEQAQVQLQNARYDLEDLQQTVALQVRQAYLNYETAEKALAVTETRLRAAAQAREAAEARYNLGAAAFVELAQANTNYVSAASARVRARYDFLYRMKLIDYYLGVLDPSEPLFP